jgi:hypothetical protein
MPADPVFDREIDAAFAKAAQFAIRAVGRGFSTKGSFSTAASINRGHGG